ncbi:MAG: hypothetical protein OXH52_06140 [Gammaproteobacteria bacterium]|nr:hypothetical protein [Gammaproteobacteria bacterium]
MTKPWPSGSGTAGGLSLERRAAAAARTRLEVATVDQTVALGVIVTSDEAVALGLELLRLAGGPGSPSRGARPAGSGVGNAEDPTGPSSRLRAPARSIGPRGPALLHAHRQTVPAPSRPSGAAIA